MARVAVFGANGMLGREVFKCLNAEGHRAYTIQHRLEDENLYAYKWVTEVDAVINCAGKRPGTNPLSMVQSNAMGPHLLAQQFKGHIIHVSTDCVFSGVRYDGGYYPDSRADPIDPYGKTKLAGEVDASHVTNVRTSFIGFNHGLLAWLISAQDNEVFGYTNAMWSGSTVYEVARELVKLLDSPIRGIIHLSTAEPVSKYNLLCDLSIALNLNIRVEPVSEPHINRALVPTWILQGLEINNLGELSSEYFRRNSSRTVGGEQAMVI